MRRLGPFELLEPLAEGGMGVVWRGMHTGQRVPVGIKLVGTDSRKARLAFRDEVQAMAGLHHPGVVMVFDYGEVPADFPDTPGVPAMRRRTAPARWRPAARSSRPSAARASSAVR